jgi:ketosteroid isomerase-like protein
VSKEVADDFVEALRKLEEDRDVEALVEIHTEDCEVGNVAVSKTFRGHDSLREFWTEYRKTFGEMKSSFRNVFATEKGAALEWTTEGTSDGDRVSYDGVSMTPATSPFRSWIDGDTVAAHPVEPANTSSAEPLSSRCWSPTCIDNENSESHVFDPSFSCPYSAEGRTKLIPL